MKIISLSISQLRSRPFNSILSICMFAFGVGIISLLIHFEQFAQKQVKGNLAGIDLVAGAKGSPLQLIMSSVLHADYPTGNIPLAEADRIAKNPLVEKTIPIALGDNYKGFRIIGTSKGYIDQYSGKLKKGEWNSKAMEVVIGGAVAKSTGLEIGDVFSGVHGFMKEGHSHDNHKYVVTGILQVTGTVIDRIIITNIESVWSVHDTSNEYHHNESEQNERGCNHNHSECNYAKNNKDCSHEHDHSECEHEQKECEHEQASEETEDNKDHIHSSELAIVIQKVENKEELSEHEINLFRAYKAGNKNIETQSGKEITALLVFYRNPMAATTLPRLINENTSMQAASPALELNRLMSLLGFGFNVLNVLAWIIIIFSGINIMIHLLNKLNQEINEVALLRSMGVGKFSILLLLLWEGIILAVTGWILGMGIVRLSLFAINNFTDNSVISMPYIIIDKEIILLLFSLGVGAISAIIPAIRAYRTDVHFLLNKL